MKAIEFCVSGRPRPKPAHEHNRGGAGGHKSAAQTAREAHIQAAFMEATKGRWEPLTGLVRLSVVAVFRLPKAEKKARREEVGRFWRTIDKDRPVQTVNDLLSTFRFANHYYYDMHRLKTPDSDNIIKLIGDALNKRAWVDDMQVQVGCCWRIWGLKDETKILIEGV